MMAETGHRTTGSVYLNLAAAPVLGLLYVIVLPFIAVGTVLVMGAEKVVGGLYRLAGNLISFGWRPSEAHLTGKKKEKKNKENGRRE